MKDWIQELYDDQDKLSYNTRRKALREAWDAVTPEQQDELLDSTPKPTSYIKFGMTSS